MKKWLKNVKNKLKKRYKTLRGLLSNSWCYYFYYHARINENLVFVSSRDGKDFMGNIFRIVEELSKNDYRGLEIVIYARRDIHPMIRELQRNYTLKPVKLVSSEDRAVAVMERAKYIISDSGVPWKYVKREGQVVLNTWHGTPLKVMGRRIDAEKHRIGTTQHFFFSSDYLLYPSEYMKATMLHDYMVENVMSGKALMSGYPRNEVFFNNRRRSEMRSLFGYDEKTVYAYMPTHRGTMVKLKNKQQLEAVLDYLADLDAWMEEDQVLLVKLHVFNQSKIDFAQFQHIVPFPTGYETYDVLNTVDCLITDYSSVFFDFANTGRKVILFAYDEEEYFEDRGTYFPLSELPFPIVKDTEALYREMNLPKEYDDQAFLDRFCTYDKIGATDNLCRHVFKNEKICNEVSFGNQKENVLIYGGSLSKNGITTAFVQLLNKVDYSKRNYYACFRRQEVNGEPGRVDLIPQVIDYLPLMNDPVHTLRERMAFKRFKNSSNFNEPYPHVLHRLFQRELDRYFWGASFSNMIHFDGYNPDSILLFRESSAKKAIFVHNDMMREISLRRNQPPAILRLAYSTYDRVAIVSPDLMEPTIQVGAPKEKIVVINNVQDAESIRERGEMPITFEKDTECRTGNPAGIEGVLSAPGKKFITIGRFSPEKGHKRLLNAFDEFCMTYPDTQLIIIGGHGPLYNKTLGWVKQMNYWKNVTIIKSIQNPMPILKRCDLFILSSLYEGLGLVILEADCLGVPSFSTEVNGPTTLMKQHEGYLVEDSQEAILQGMYDYMEGKISTLKIDYQEYLLQAVSEFESLVRGNANE